MAIPKRIKIERVYVKVASEFDSTGYMQPTSITWADGRTFPIETVRDFRPAGPSLSKPSGTSGRQEPQTTTAMVTVSLS